MSERVQHAQEHIHAVKASRPPTKSSHTRPLTSAELKENLRLHAHFDELERERQVPRRGRKSMEGLNDLIPGGKKHFNESDHNPVFINPRRASRDGPIKDIITDKFSELKHFGVQ